MERREIYKRYYLSPKGRANYLSKNYKKQDKRNGLDNGDITSEWIYNNILFKPCSHCGKEGWKLIGCNRIDDSKPHSMDNVEPCCKECNDKLARGKEKKEVYQYTLGLELVKKWDSIKDAFQFGYDRTCISSCCNGKQKTHKGYKWSFKPL